MLKTRKNGFTLAEMLIALALIGVIAALVIPKLLLSSTQRQESTQVKDSVSMIERAYREAIADPDYPLNKALPVGPFIKDKLAVVETGSAAYDVPDLFPTDYKTACMGGPNTSYYRFADNTLVVIAGDPSASSTANERTFICIDTNYKVATPHPTSGCSDTVYRGVLQHNTQKFNWNPDRDTNPSHITWFYDCTLPASDLLNS